MVPNLLLDSFFGGGQRISDNLLSKVRISLCSISESGLTQCRAEVLLPAGRKAGGAGAGAEAPLQGLRAPCGDRDTGRKQAVPTRVERGWVIGRIIPAGRPPWGKLFLTLRD